MRGLRLLLWVCALALAPSGLALGADWPEGLSFHAGVDAEVSAAPPGYVSLADDSGAVFYVDPQPTIGASEIECLGKGRDWAGLPALDGRFTEAGSRRFSDYTRDHIGGVFIILFDGKIVSVPRIMSQIPGPGFNVSGGVPASTDAWLKASGLRRCKPLSRVEQAAVNLALRDRLIEDLSDPRSMAYEQLIGLVNAKMIPMPSDQELWSWLQTAIRAGDPSAMSALAQSYEFGAGVEPDLALARQWWHKAAEAGEPTAVFHLAWIYADGRGVPADPREAAMWFGRIESAFFDRAMLETLARDGDPYSMLTLGILLLHSDRLPRDAKAAEHWLREAAEKDEPMAMYALGRMHAATDRKLAIKWLRRAAKLNYWPATVALRELEQAA